MLKILLAVWHLSPIVPLIWGYYYAAIAVLGFVAIPYIKVKKFESQIAVFESGTADFSAEIADLQMMRKRWIKPTYLQL